MPFCSNELTASRPAGASYNLLLTPGARPAQRISPATRRAAKVRTRLSGCWSGMVSIGGRSRGERMTSDRRRQIVFVSDVEALAKSAAERLLTRIAQGGSRAAQGGSRAAQGGSRAAQGGSRAAICLT